MSHNFIEVQCGVASGRVVRDSVSCFMGSTPAMSLRTARSNHSQPVIPHYPDHSNRIAGDTIVNRKGRGLLISAVS